MPEVPEGADLPDVPRGRLVAGRYRVESLLGGGGSSRVYLATDEVLDRQVALKVHAVAGKREDERQHLREARLLARLGHPQLVEVYDVGQDASLAWTVMRFVPGGTLAGPRGVPRRRSVADVTRLGAELADALDHAHRHGIVHRDVKPANVLLDHDGSALLGDFGIARSSAAAGTTAAGTVLGTPGYLAPEQVRGDRVTPAADVYALGVVLVESLTGEREYAGAGWEAAVARLSRPPRVPAGLPPALGGLLTEMTAASPEGRPTAAQVRDRLLAVAAQSRTTDPAAPSAGEETGRITRPLTLPVLPGRGPRVRPRDGDVVPTRGIAAAAVAVLAAAAVALLTGAALHDDGPAAGPRTTAPRASSAATQAPSKVATTVRASTAPATAKAVPSHATTTVTSHHGKAKGRHKHHH